MVNTNTVSEKIYNVLKGFGLVVNRYDQQGNLTLSNEETRRFSVSEPNIMVRFNTDSREIILMTGPGDLEKKIRTMLKNTATNNLCTFNYRQFNRKISPRGEKPSVVDSMEKTSVTENNDKHKVNRIWAMIADYEQRAKKTKNSIKKTHYLNMANDLRRELPTRDHVGETKNDFGELDVDSSGKPTKGSEEQMTKYNNMMKKQKNRDVINKNTRFEKEKAPSRTSKRVDWDAAKNTPKNQETFDSKRGEERNMEEGTNYIDLDCNVLEGFGSMTGSTKTSYQPLDNVKIVVKHRKPVNEESRGSRSRNIHSIYIQRGDERFRLPENDLKAARAMARHVTQGGEIHDSVGTSIMEMAGEQRRLAEFLRYVRNRNMVNEHTQEYVEIAQESVKEIKSLFHRLSGIKGYANAVESVVNRGEIQQLDEDDGIESMFTETHFDDRVGQALGSIRMAKARRQKFQEHIEKTIARQDFSGFMDMVNETQALHEEPHQKLAHQVRSLAMCVEDSTLKGFLTNIGEKISMKESLSAFETLSVKQCVSKLQEPMNECVKEHVDPLEKYNNILSELAIY